MKNNLLPNEHKNLILEIDHLSKSYGSNVVLSSINLSIERAKITGLIGENGAGKSTFMKILAGIIEDYTGVILWKGKKVRFKTPLEAIKNGIYMIPQELGLIPDLNAQENILLGQERAFLGFQKKKESRHVVQKAFDLLGEKIPLTIPVKNLSPSEQQLTAIARALTFQSELLILDEPTSMLTKKEGIKLAEILKKLKSQGVSIVYITHRLDELLSFSDRIIALQDGSISGDGATKDLTEEKLISWMVSPLALKKETQKEAETVLKTPHHKSVLKINHFTDEKLFDFNLELKKGEILGLVGLRGSGRTELLEAISGIRKVHRGSMEVDGKEIEQGSIRTAIENGILLSPEDRRSQGLFLDQSVIFNALLPNADLYSHFGFILPSQEKKAFQDLFQLVRVDVKDPKQAASSLSGGNQQRLILGKILLRGGKILLLDEITAGVDARTTSEILEHIRQLSTQGISIIFASSDWRDVMKVSHRVIVMNDGKVLEEIPQVNFDQNLFMNEIMNHIKKQPETLQPHL